MISFVINIFIRISSMSGKFLLLFLLSKRFNSVLVGDYGIVLSVSSILLYFIGLDYYIFNSRLILSNVSDKHSAITNQSIFVLINMFVCVPFFLLLWKFGFVSSSIAALLALIVIFDVLSQECGRLLITYSAPLKSNILFFMRNGLWGILSSILILTTSKITNLKSVLFIWLICSLLSAILGFFWVRSHLFYSRWFSYFNFSKMITVAKASVIVFSSSLCLLLNQNLDKFFIKKSDCYMYLGAYTFFNSIAGIVPTLIYTGLVNIYYPKFITSYHDDSQHFSKMLRSFSYRLIFISSFLILIQNIVIFKLLTIVDKKDYFDVISVFRLMTFSVFMTLLSLIPHYYLFVLRKDREIALSSVFSTFVLLISMPLFLYLFGIYGAAFANIISITTLLLAKVIYLRSHFSGLHNYATVNKQALNVK